MQEWYVLHNSDGSESSSSNARTAQSTYRFKFNFGWRVMDDSLGLLACDTRSSEHKTSTNHF